VLFSSFDADNTIVADADKSSSTSYAMDGCVCILDTSSSTRNLDYLTPARDVTKFKFDNIRILATSGVFDIRRIV